MSGEIDGRGSGRLSMVMPGLRVAGRMMWSGVLAMDTSIKRGRGTQSQVPVPLSATPSAEPYGQGVTVCTATHCAAPTGRSVNSGPGVSPLP
jgi:hypothetical protein